MENLRSKLTDVIAEAIPDTKENQKFCANEDEYEDNGFYEMMDKVIAIVVDHITGED